MIVQNVVFYSQLAVRKLRKFIFFCRQSFAWGTVLGSISKAERENGFQNKLQAVLPKNNPFLSVKDGVSSLQYQNTKGHSAYDFEPLNKGHFKDTGLRGQVDKGY